jgi:hypothetical protein
MNILRQQSLRAFNINMLLVMKHTVYITLLYLEIRHRFIVIRSSNSATVSKLKVVNEKSQISKTIFLHVETLAMLWLNSTVLWYYCGTLSKRQYECMLLITMRSTLIRGRALHHTRAVGKWMYSSRQDKKTNMADYRHLITGNQTSWEVAFVYCTQEGTLPSLAMNSRGLLYLFRKSTKS